MGQDSRVCSHAAFSGERHAKHSQALPVSLYHNFEMCICIYILFYWIDIFFYMIHMYHTEKEGGMTCGRSIMFHKKKNHLGRIVTTISEILVNISEEKKGRKKNRQFFLKINPLNLSEPSPPPIFAPPGGREHASERKGICVVSCGFFLFNFSFLTLPLFQVF